MSTAVTSLPLGSTGLRVQLPLARFGAAVWRSFEVAGRVRARRHLFDFADRCQDLQPELAKELREAARAGTPF
jgi:hypothetical protein